MRLDSFWPAGDEPDEPGESRLCPDGRHTGTITKAAYRDVPYDWARHQVQNPAGTCLDVTIKVPGSWPVKATIPMHYRQRLEAVCRSARVPIPDRSTDWDETDLIGQTVVIETVAGIGKTGTEFVRIEKWHPGPEPLPPVEKARPARTPAAKVDAAGQGGTADDIPF